MLARHKVIDLLNEYENLSSFDIHSIKQSWKTDGKWTLWSWKMHI